MEAARQKTFLKYSIAVSERENDFEKSTEYILHLYPTRDDFVRNRGSIFIHYLEISGEENILSWIDYQELKIQLTNKYIYIYLYKYINIFIMFIKNFDLNVTIVSVRKLQKKRQLL